MCRELKEGGKSVIAVAGYNQLLFLYNLLYMQLILSLIACIILDKEMLYLHLSPRFRPNGADATSKSVIYL